MTDRTDAKEEIREWFDREFWPTYPNDLCEGRKGPKGEALNEMLKLAPDANERTRILENVRAQIVADRRIKKAGKWVERWPHARRYIKHRWWDNEIRHLTDVENEGKKSVSKCAGCGAEKKLLAPVDASGLLYCSKCYDERKHPDFKRQVYDNLCKHGLGKLKDETREQWMARIKEHGLRVLRQHYGKASNPKTPPSPTS